MGLALALRIGFALVYVHQHPARALGTIPFLFEPGNIAYSLATGHGFGSPFRLDTGPTAWMTPVYPLLLAGIFRIFGTYTFSAFLAAAGINILFSTLTCIPVFAAGRRIGGERTAVAGAWLWALFPGAILLPYESFFDASLSALLAATILWATLAVAESERMLAWCGYGLLWGLALMTNAALVSLLPFLLIWAGLLHPRKAVFAAALIALCCLPWTARNFIVFRTFVPLRSVGGLALWLGNNDQAQTLTPGRMHPISNQAEREKYVERGEISYIREKQAEAVDYMLAHPEMTARRAGARFLAIWIGGGANPGRNLRVYWVILFNVLAAAGTVAGLLFLWLGRSVYAFPLTAFPLVFPLVYYLALAPPRYRHPIDPALLLLTAIAFTHLSNYRNTKRPWR
jgi:hypothetical protein